MFQQSWTRHTCSFLYPLCFPSHFNFAASHAFPARLGAFHTSLFYLPDFFLCLCLSPPRLLPLISTLLEVISIEIPKTDLCWLCSQQTMAEPGLLPSPGVSIAWRCCSSQELAGYSGMFFSPVLQNWNIPVQPGRACFWFFVVVVFNKVESVELSLRLIRVMQCS